MPIAIDFEYYFPLPHNSVPLQKKNQEWRNDDITEPIFMKFWYNQLDLDINVKNIIQVQGA